MIQHPMRIRGQQVRTDATRLLRLPYDGVPFATVYDAGAEEVEHAVEAARQAAPIMRGLSREERAAVLRRAHTLLKERAAELALDVSSESGKPIRDAHGEVSRALQTLLFSAEEANRLAGEAVPLDASPVGKGYMAITIREPIGVIAAITPFNFPLNLSLHKIGPAIAGGNAVVHKPAGPTPVSAIKLATIFEDSGLPPGALNVVTGPGGRIGAQLVQHPAVNMVTFTGSMEVGLEIRQKAGLRKVTLELGNNSALIVEPDADLDELVPRAVTAAFALSGQSCISLQRVYAHSSIHAELVERMAARTGQLRVGHPHLETTDVSSLISEADADRIEEWIQEAVAAGATLVCGGRRAGPATVEPAVISQAPDRVRLSCREAFGPVVVINSYESLQEAIARVNTSDYGLQAGIYTRDIRNAFHAAHQVHVGGFLINEVPTWRADQMPYGGVKRSGSGREGPKYALEEMTEPKLVVWKL
jgi:acyl-CoA reductase-like NAD-dependent aldehyde dehydrogenase